MKEGEVGADVGEVLAEDGDARVSLNLNIILSYFILFSNNGLPPVGEWKRDLHPGELDGGVQH